MRAGGDDQRQRRAELSVSDELNIDLAPDGTVNGIELLSANEQLRRIVVVDEARGEERALALASEPRP